MVPPSEFKLCRLPYHVKEPPKNEEKKKNPITYRCNISPLKMSTKISYSCSVLEENEKRRKKKEETSVLGDTVNVNQPSAAERALMLSIRASLCTIVGRQALPNVSILCLLSVAFHKRCSEVGAVFPAKVTKSAQKLSVFKYQNSRFEKIAEILLATNELLLATVGILDDPPTLWTCIIWRADDGWAARCPDEPFGKANHCSCISLPTPLGAAVARQ